MYQHLMYVLNYLLLLCRFKLCKIIQYARRYIASRRVLMLCMHLHSAPYQHPSQPAPTHITTPSLHTMHTNVTLNAYVRTPYTDSSTLNHTRTPYTPSHTHRRSHHRPRDVHVTQPTTHIDHLNANTTIHTNSTSDDPPPSPAAHHHSHPHSHQVNASYL